MVVEALAARDLDVHEHEPEPLRVVEGPLAVDRPAHRSRLGGPESGDATEVEPHGDVRPDLGVFHGTPCVLKPARS